MLLENNEQMTPVQSIQRTLSQNDKKSSINELKIYINFKPF